MSAGQKAKIDDIWASMNASEASRPGGASGSGLKGGKGKEKTKKKKKAIKKANKVMRWNIYWAWVCSWWVRCFIELTDTMYNTFWCSSVQ